MPPTPSTDLLNQYGIVTILVFFAAVIAAAFYKLWRDWVKWMTDQDLAREVEREKQRTWQAEQDKIRDERWQSFLEKLQGEWIKQDGRHTDVLLSLVSKVDELLKEVRSHDTWTRAKDRE